MLLSRNSPATVCNWCTNMVTDGATGSAGMACNPSRLLHKNSAVFFPRLFAESGKAVMAPPMHTMPLADEVALMLAFPQTGFQSL